MAEADKPGILQRWLATMRGVRGRDSSPLNLPAGKRATRADPSLASSLDPLLTGRFIRITNSATHEVFSAQSLIFKPGAQHESTFPGSRNPLGVHGIWGMGANTKGELTWIDDPVSGLFSRTRRGFHEVLGARGIIEGVPYLFESVLQIGRNTVVYQLTNLKTGCYAGVSLNRDMFDPLYGLTSYLNKVRDGLSKYSAERIIVLSDRVLQTLPEDRTALLSKGVALLSQRDYEHAHSCFEALLRVHQDAQPALLHDAVALAMLGDDHRSLQRFAAAHRISQSQCNELLQSSPHMHDALLDLVSRQTAADAGAALAGELSLRYFPPPAEPPAPDGVVD